MENIKVFFEGFDTAEDVFNAFNIPQDDTIKFIYAYHNDDYHQQVHIVLVKDDKLYEVDASCCSCYGLDDQWDLEETSVESLRMRSWWNKDVENNINNLYLNK